MWFYGVDWKKYIVYSPSRKTCEICEESIGINVFEFHHKACKIYGRFIGKTSDEYQCYQCLLCSEIHSERKSLYIHIKKEHMNEIKINPKSVEETIQLEDNKNVSKTEIADKKIIQVKFTKSDKLELKDR